MRGKKGKPVHWVSLFEYKKIRKKKTKKQTSNNIKGNLEIQLLNSVSFFWQPLKEQAVVYIHHPLCFFTRENIPASLGTLTQAVQE